MNRVLRRLAWAAAVVCAVVSMVFALSELLPGDPARMAAGLQARPADVARIRDQLGLDRPPLVRYARFWRRLVHLGPRTGAAGSTEHADCAVVLTVGEHSAHVDFGRSFQLRRPVVELVGGRWPRTATLAIAGVFVQLLLGVTAGTLAAVRRSTSLDRALVSVSLVGISAPTFLVGLGLQWLLARKLRVLPLDGFGSTLAEHLRCLVLPALTLGICGAAYYTRLVRDEMCVVLGRDWVRTARAKGLSGWRVVMAHGLRNILVPLVTAVGLDLGSLMGGAVVTETMFRWPGLGDLSVRATLNRDGPVLSGCVIVTAIAVVAANLAVDLVYPRLDPSLSVPRERGTR